MKVLVTATPAIGHINPMLSIARIFADHGHEVLFQTASVHRDRIERAGLTFRPFAPGADIDLRDIDAFLPERKTIPPGPEMLRFDFEHVFVDSLVPQHEGLCATLRDWPADVILADTTFYGTLPMLLGVAARRPAIVHCGITCLFTEREDGAPPLLGLPLTDDAAQRREYAKIYSQVEEVLLTPVGQAFDQRLEEVGAPPMPGVFPSVTTRLADLHLQPTVPSFEYPSRFTPPGVRFIGALPAPQSDLPLPDWASELDGSKRVVLVTQGTVANFDLGQVIAPTLAALADMPDVLTLVTTGGRPLEAIPGPIPANARLATFLPFDKLLPKVDVVVTNGGYGTVGLALERGIPLIAAGLTEDKAEISARIGWSGVGVNLASNAPEPDAIQSAVRRVLDMSQYRRRAAEMAFEFARYDAAADILRLVGALVAERRTTLAA